MTKHIIESMLKESTGKAMMDSGGKNGRHWQQNQERNFESEPFATIDFSYGYPDFSHNIYHWLCERLEYDRHADRLFGEFASLADNEDRHWLALMQAFPEWLSRHKGLDGIYSDPAGIYGDGEPITVNSYNHECLLSQTIQFHYWSCNAGVFIALQIHNGADVRGGYTRPRIFEVSGNYDETAIFDFGRGSVRCDNGDCGYWDTDDGYDWHHESGYSHCDLRDREVVDVDDLESFDMALRGDGSNLLFIAGSRALCPHCGDGWIGTGDISEAQASEGDPAFRVARAMYQLIEHLDGIPESFPVIDEGDAMQELVKGL